MSPRSTAAARVRAGSPAPAEPVLEADDIQGNIVPGFLKPQQRIVALEIGDAGAARRWLADLAPRLTTLGQVVPSRLAVRRHRGLRRQPAAELNPLPDGVDDTWMNVALSYAGLQKLAAGNQVLTRQLYQFQDDAFILGLAARASRLGDPGDPAAPGHPGNWLVGGSAGDPDVLLILAADRAVNVDTVILDPGRHGLREVFSERSHKLNATGAEHFGFKDGISQPGLRGRFAEAEDALITPRPLAQGSPEALLYGLPGQYLLWPGEFVFGYPGQSAHPLIPGPVNLPGPAWSRNGSYLVFRRLRQDVAGFSALLERGAGQLVAEGWEGMTPERLGALLVGRWPSGAPVSRTPGADLPELGADRLENNRFELGAELPPLEAGGDPGQVVAWPQAAGDPLGLICPQAAHIRKVNTRLAANDQGGRRASFRRRILRRGLPYGQAWAEGERSGIDRGLHFISYQASITDQFELLVSWMNSPVAPRSPCGHDLLVGQNGQPGGGRTRTATLIGPQGRMHEISTDRELVTATGGGYFFSPSISALREVLGAPG